MFKDNYSVKNSLKKLFLQRYERYLPTAFDESMSILEKMNKLIESQNALIDVVNAHKDHTSDQLERAFDIIDNNLDLQLQAFRDELIEQKTLYEEIRDKIHSDLLPDSVRRILEEWELDGTIESMLSEHVLTEIHMRLEDVENRVEENENMQDVLLPRFIDMAEIMDNGELDWSVPLQHAIDNYDYIVIPEGEYNIDPITLDNTMSGKTIVGRGDSTVINVNSGSDLFKLYGDEGEFKRVTSDYVRGSNTLYLENTSGLNAGDNVLIQSEMNALSKRDSGSDWVLGNGTGSNPQRVPFGEFGIIDSVYSDRIVLVNTPTYHQYHASNSGQFESVQAFSTVKKIDFVENITIKDITIGQVPSGFALRTRLAKNVVLDGVKFIDGNETSSSRGVANIQLSYGCEVRNSIYEAPRNMGYDDSNYWQQNPYKVTSSQNCGIYACKGVNSAQMVDFSFLTGYMPNTGCYIKDCRSVNASNSGFTTHGGNYLTQFTGNYVEGARQGFSHRGRGATISNNVFVGNSYSEVGSNLLSGISLYEQGAVDNVITGNVFRNFANGVSYSDSSNGRADYINTVISNNTFQNCSRQVWVYRFHSNNPEIPKTDLNLLITNNVFNLVNNTNNSAVSGIELNQRNGGVTISSNIFKGIPSEMAGLNYPRKNNFTGVRMLGNNDNVSVFNNTFIDLDYAIRHEGTTDVATDGVYPDGVEFYNADNKKINVRLADFYRAGVIHVGKQFMTSKLNSDGILTGYGVEQIPLKFRETSGTPMTRNSGQEIVLGDGLYEFNWHFTMYGLTGSPTDSVDIRVKLNDTPIIKYLVRDNEENTISIKFMSKKGDKLTVTAQKSSADLNCRIEDLHVDNRASIYTLGNN